MTTRTDTADPLAAFDLDALRRFGLARLAFGFLVTLLAVAVLFVAFAVGLARAFDGRAMAGVQVAGVSIAGLSRAEAEARLRSELPSLGSGRLTLTLDGHESVLGYRDLGRDYDLDAMLTTAMTIGHSGNGFEQALDSIRSLVRGTIVEPVARYDAQAARDAVAAAVAQARVEPVDASVAIAASGAFHITAATEGSEVDLAMAEAAVAERMRSTDPADAHVSLGARAVEPAVTTAEAEAAAEAATLMTSEPLTITYEDESFSVPETAIKSTIGFETTVDGGYRPIVASDKLAETLEPYLPTIEQAPRNARFEFSGGRPTAVVEAVPGLGLDADATSAAVAEALLARVDGTDPGSVELALTMTDPPLTTAQATAALPRLTKLSSWTVYYPVGIKNFYGKNITIPTSRIDGYTLAPGEWFDFWAAVGDVSYASGFGPGGAIINGRTEPTGALAGGICSCSTTLFNAAARAGLEMGTRQNHYYYISRYPVGLDATVWKDSDGRQQSMSFRNDTDAPIAVHGINGYGAVTFEIWGIDDGRSTSFSRPATWNYRAPKDTVKYVTTLAPGVRRRIESPITGFDSSVTRVVRAADGTVLHEDTWVSHYAAIDGIVEVGKARRSTNDNDSGGTDGGPDGGDEGTDGGG